LDRSHGQVISGLELHDGPEAFSLRIHTAANADAELELWATSRHTRPFEKLVGKPVKLEVAPTTRVTRRGPSGSLVSDRTVPLDAARRRPLK